MQLNAQRLKMYKSKLIVFPRKRGKPKSEAKHRVSGMLGRLDLLAVALTRMSDGVGFTKI